MSTRQLFRRSSEDVIRLNCFLLSTKDSRNGSTHARDLKFAKLEMNTRSFVPRRPRTFRR